MNFLTELFRGNIHPFEQRLAADEELIKQIIDAEHRFTDSLSTEQRELFDQYDNLRLQLDAVDMEQRFADAFRLGARMMLDVL